MRTCRDRGFVKAVAVWPKRHRIEVEERAVSGIGVKDVMAVAE